jgi:hypothetical protein
MTAVYADVDDLKDRLGISLNDARESTLNQAIAAASRWVENQLGGRRFYTVNETRYYTLEQTGRTMSSMGYGLSYGGGAWSVQSATWGMGSASRIVIDDAVSVTSVATDPNGDGSYDTPWTVTTDYWVGPRNAPAMHRPYRTINRNLAVGRYGFPWWEDSIQVSGAFGYATTAPDEIREVTLAAAELFARDVMEMSIPGVESYSLSTDLKVNMAPADLPMVCQKTLTQYRDTQFLI